MRKPSILAIACLALLGAGCSSSSPESVSCANPVSATTVKLVDYAFDPGCTQAAPGATLTIMDTGAIPHTFTVTGTSVDVAVAAGESKQVMLTGLAAGTYEVVCKLHNEMRGSLKIA
jgi:plastocyanin